ncbi:MAG: hypothetical protein NTY83_02000, partial [Candidatus Micrarchaeota archaeon]|nr:hypothetical protein [Candidatus Micrarchaeota archaeon]
MTICSYQGPDISGHDMEMSDFLITGPSNPSLGDSVRISFTIRNGGNDVINLTDKGVFAAVRDGGVANRDFGFTSRNVVLEPDDMVDFEGSLTLDKRGLWLVWPSYEIWKTAYSAPLGHYITLKVKGPDNWNACEVPICPDYCEDGVHYYGGYMGQEDCIYSEEECTAGCDEEGIGCDVADTTAPEVSITSSPPEPSTASRITFTAIATDNQEVGTIRIIVNGRTAEECEPPQHFERDDYWQCTYAGGPYNAGILGYYAEAEDGAGNVGVSEEKEVEISGLALVIPEEPVIPEEEHPMQCTISGVLYNFSYYSKTLGVRVCQAQKMGGCLSRPPYTCAASTVVCKEGGTSWNASITRLWAGEERHGEPGPMRYEVTLPCDGMYLITPENREYGDECRWQGRWVAEKANSFFINASDLEGFDFTFAPLDETDPVIMPQIIAGAPPAGSFESPNYTLSVGATDANGIAKITVNGSDARAFFQSNESGPLQYSRPNQTQVLYKSCSSSPCNISLQNAGEKSRTLNLKISVCDGAGNKEELVYNHTVPDARGDLEVLSVEPVQVLYGAPLVKGKNTAFRVKVRSTFAYPVETKFRLALPESEWDKLPGTGGGSIAPPAGWSYPESWGPALIPAGADGFEIILPVMPDWKKDYPFSFTDNPNGIIEEMMLGGEVWPKERAGPKPKTDSVSFAVDVDPENRIAEVSEGNNHASGNADVVTTRAWKFCFVPDSFSLRRSPDEYMSSYEHYLHQQGYADWNDRITDVRDWENR